MTNLHYHVTKLKKNKNYRQIIISITLLLSAYPIIQNNIKAILLFHEKIKPSVISDLSIKTDKKNKKLFELIISAIRILIALKTMKNSITQLNILISQNKLNAITNIEHKEIENNIQKIMNIIRIYTKNTRNIYNTTLASQIQNSRIKIQSTASVKTRTSSNANNSKNVYML